MLRRRDSVSHGAFGHPTALAIVAVVAAGLYLALPGPRLPTVNAGSVPTTTTLWSVTNPTVYGQMVDLRATVTGAGVTPTGTVTFMDGGTTLCGGPQSLGTYGWTFCQSYGWTVGYHTITAYYSGDSTYAASSNSSVTQTVTKSDTTTTVYSTQQYTVVGQAVTFTASVCATPWGCGYPTGTATFFDGASALCTAIPIDATYPYEASCGPITTLSAGTHSITATYSGDTNYSSSTSNVLSQVVWDTTTTILTVAPNPSAYTQSVTLSATVTESAPGTPTGLVTWYYTGPIMACNDTLDAAGHADCVPGSPPPGTYGMYAVYSGDANFSGSTSSTVNWQVDKSATTTAVLSNVNPALTGHAVTFTATITRPFAGYPTGTVQFYIDGAPHGSPATVSTSTETATSAPISTLTLGNHTITATYSGDANFSGSTSASYTQTVKATTTTTVTVDPNPSGFTQSVTLHAMVTSQSSGTPTGWVTWYINGEFGCHGELVDAHSTCSVFGPTAGRAVGANPVYAVYGGDGTFAGSASPTVDYVVTKSPTTTTVTSNLNPVTVGQPVTFKAAVTRPYAGWPTGSVQFYIDGSAYGAPVPIAADRTATAPPISTLTPGVHTITASYPGDTNFESSTSADYAQTVNKFATAVTVTSNANPMVYFQPVTFTATVAPAPPATSTPTGSVTFYVDGSAYYTATLYGGQGNWSALTSGLSVGNRTITAAYSGDTSFNAGTSPGYTETVNKAETTVSLTSEHNPSVHGQYVRFAATVTPVSPSMWAGASGTVTFRADGEVISIPTTIYVAGTYSSAATAGLDSLTTGSHAISATYNGNAYLNSSTGPPLTQTVNKADTTMWITGIEPLLTVTGQPYTVSWTVIPVAPGAGTPTGTVTVSGGSECTAAVGAGSCSLASTSSGLRSLVATYRGDGAFNGSASAPYDHGVNRAQTTATLTSDVNPSTYMSDVTLTANVAAAAPGAGTPSGSVHFRHLDGGTWNTFATVSLAGGSATTMVANLPPGANSLRADYVGDTDFYGSNSTAMTQDVNRLATTTTLAPTPLSVFGQPVAFTATIDSDPPVWPHGDVEFWIDGVLAGTAAVDNHAQAISDPISGLAVGTHQLTAVYLGDANLEGSTSAPRSHIVHKAETTTVITGVDPTVTVVGESLTVSWVVQPVAPGAGTPSGTVSVSGSIIGCSAPVEAGQCTLTEDTAGTHVLVATYAGDDSFSDSSSVGTVHQVGRASTTTVVSSDTNPVPFGQPVTFTATVTVVLPGAGTPTDSVDFHDDGSLICADVALNGAGEATCGPFSDLAAGDHPITAEYAGDIDFAGSTSSIHVQSVVILNHVPQGADNTVTTDQDTAYVFGAADFGFSDPDDDPPDAFDAVRIASDPGLGSLVLDDIVQSAGAVIGTDDIEDGLLAFEPVADGSGSPYTSFTFQVRDDGIANNLDPSANTMTINVRPVAPHEPETTITLGPTGWTNDATPTFEFRSDTPGATYQCSDDGGAFEPCTTPHTMPALPDGPHTCTVRALNGATPDPTPAEAAFTVDTELPYTGYVEVMLAEGGQVSSGPVALTWQASDNLAPDAELVHEWQYRRKLSSGAWGAWQPGGKVSGVEVVHPQPLWRWIEYRVRTRDLAGNASAWEDGATIRLLRRQEDDFGRSADWVIVPRAGALGGKVATSSTVGASAKLRFYGNGVALVMPAAADLGTIRVCLDRGTTTEECRTVDLATFTPTGERRLVITFTELPVRWHWLKLTVLSGTVYLDGALISQ